MNEIDYPLVEAFKRYNSELSFDLFLELPANTPFGNLNLNWVEMLLRIDYVNELIIKVYNELRDIISQRKETPFGNPNQLFEQKILTEQIFYWLRKTSDELISMVWLLDYYKENRRYPAKIKISSIGEYIKTHDFLHGKLDSYKDFLLTLNEISNGYKHSFLNSQIHNYQAAGETPLVFALSLRFNNLKNKPTFYTIELREILENFNAFLIEIKDIIQTKLETK